MPMHDESYHLSNISTSIVQLWEILRDRYLELGDTDLNFRRNYISIRKNGVRTRAICYVHFYTDNILITISEGYIRSNGIRSGNFIELVDPENIGERRISNNRDGSSNYEYHIRVSSNRSLELAISIINQRYQAY